MNNDHQHLWREEEQWIAWSSGGFADGTLVRHCKCGYAELCEPKTYNYEFATDKWDWDAENMEECRKAFNKIN